MSFKKFIEEFYKSDALINGAILDQYLHPDVVVEWQSSKGPLSLNRESLIQLANELGRAYIRSKVRLSHIIEENDYISVRYSHHIKTIENPREEILLANFMAIWEIKDGKLFRGWQMSQL